MGDQAKVNATLLCLCAALIAVLFIAGIAERNHMDTVKHRCERAGGDYVEFAPHRGVCLKPGVVIRSKVAT